jgi:glycosyltransferase involved in cell wall biosynthesis
LKRKTQNSPQLSICHVVTADLWAGAEVQIANLLTRLSREPEFRILVIALGEGRLTDELRKADIELKFVPQPHRRFTACYRQAYGFLRGRSIDIIHSHKSKENVLAFFVAKSAGIPHLVRTQHGRAELKTLKDYFVYALERMTLRAVNQVLNGSSDLGRRTARYLDRSKVKVVRNAINLDEVSSALTHEAAKRKLGIPENALLVGTAARLEPVKRIDIFLETARHIGGHLANVFFVVAGDGSERARMEQRIRRTALESRVRFLGHRDDVYDILRALDLLLITSDHEGLPTVVLEAMALGTPVVSRNVGGIAEAIDDRGSGVLVDSSDPRSIAQACLPLLTDRDMACRLSRAAREKVVENFSADANAAQVAQIYRSLTSPGTIDSLSHRIIESLKKPAAAGPGGGGISK